MKSNKIISKLVFAALMVGIVAFFAINNATASSAYEDARYEATAFADKCGGEKADAKKESKCGDGKEAATKDVKKADAKEEAKCGEGKCGDGKKADVKKEMKKDEAKKEAKCGEGKCGDGKKVVDKEAKKADAKKEAKCGEGKCGEGKCG